MKSTITLTIDNVFVSVLERLSIIESCELSGIVVPRFCYHEILSVSGNCRMCVVEVDAVEKPVASCATEAKSGMDVYTNNAFVKKARENIVEFLLLNHPLDCPICDQAGECDFNSILAQVRFIVVAIGLETSEGLSSVLFFTIIYILKYILLWGNLILINSSNTDVSLTDHSVTDSLY